MKFRGFFERDVVLTSPYGMRINPVTKVRELHDGCDFDTNEGDNLRLPTVGQNSVKFRITRNRIDKKADNVVYCGFQDLSHTLKIEFWLFHIEKCVLNEGKTAHSKTYLGKAGNTGQSTGSHTHICAIINGKRVDPLPYLDTYTKNGKTYLRGWVAPVIEQPEVEVPKPPTTAEELKTAQAQIKILELELQQTRDTCKQLLNEAQQSQNTLKNKQEELERVNILLEAEKRAANEIGIELESIKRENQKMNDRVSSLLDELKKSQGEIEKLVAFKLLHEDNSLPVSYYVSALLRRIAKKFERQS